LLHDFTELLSDDFPTIMKYDPLEVPKGIPITSNGKGNYDKNLANMDKELEDLYRQQLKDKILERDILDFQKANKRK
jgi:hypothetical protein